MLNEAVTAYELVFRSNQGDKVRVFYTRGKFQKLSHLVRLLKRSRMQAIHPSRMQSAPSPGHTRSWSVEIPGGGAWRMGNRQAGPRHVVTMTQPPQD